MRRLLALLLPALALSACGDSGRSDQRGPDGAPPVSARADAPVRVGGNPVGVAVGEDGVWVLDQARARLTRHDPQSGRRSGRAVPVGTSPITVAVGEGFVWVLDGAAGVQRIDSSTGRPSGDPVAVSDPNGIAVGAGAVWVTSRAGRSVTRIDAATLRRDPPIKVGVGPADIVFADGGLWVAEADAGSLRRIDARTREISKPLRLARGQVLALAAGDGALFAAVSRNELNDDIQLVRIDPRAAKVTGAPVPVTGGVPLRLAAGSGSVWLTDVGSSLPGSPARAPALVRVDHGRGSVRSVVEMAGRPSAVAAVPGAVWVTDSTRGTLTRVALGG